MIKTALSASLIALAVLAPAASAASEPKAKPTKEPKASVRDDKTAKYCAELAALMPDKKGKVTLTKEQLVVQSHVECSLDKPANTKPVDFRVAIGSDKRVP
jgi:hypothetical protein